VAIAVFNQSALLPYIPWLVWALVVVVFAAVLLILAGNRGFRRWIVYRRMYHIGFATARSGGRSVDALNATIASFVLRLQNDAESALKAELRRRPFSALAARYQELSGSYEVLAREVILERRATDGGVPPPRRGSIPTPWYLVGQSIFGVGDVIFTSLGLQAFHLETLYAWLMALVFGGLLAFLGDRVGVSLKSPDRIFEARLLASAGAILSLALICARVSFLIAKHANENIAVQAGALAVCSLMLFVGSIVLGLYHKDDLEHRLVTTENDAEAMRAAHERERSGYARSASAFVGNVKVNYTMYEGGVRKGWLGTEKLIFPELTIEIPTIEPLPPLNVLVDPRYDRLRSPITG
jgi:hypothetical protein